jgi:hypothetical protein
MQDGAVRCTTAEVIGRGREDTKVITTGKISGGRCFGRGAGVEQRQPRLMQITPRWGFFQSVLPLCSRSIFLSCMHRADQDRGDNLARPLYFLITGQWRQTLAHWISQAGAAQRDRSSWTTGTCATAAMSRSFSLVFPSLLLVISTSPTLIYFVCLSRRFANS